MTDGATNDTDKLLRQEIIESQKTQADFLKWKLISVATVASIAFGFAPVVKPTSDSSRLLICLIPLLCAYVDLISLHMMIRIITIGIYLRMYGNEYEKYVFVVRGGSGANPFVFEAVALHGSSLVFNSSVIILFFVLPRGPDGWAAGQLTSYLVAGITGIAMTLLLWRIYILRARKVFSLAEEFKRSRESPPSVRKSKSKE